MTFSRILAWGVFLASNWVAASPQQVSAPAPGVYINSQGSPLIPLLEAARSSIDIEIYTMTDRTVRGLIRQALARGVRVRILKDPKPLGEKCNLFDAISENSTDCTDQRKLVSDVRDAGGVFEPFDKKALCPNGGGTGGDGCFEHGKIVLSDGLAMVSTGNFDGTNLCIDGSQTCDRDYSLMIQDPAIYGTLKNLFEADLRGTAYDVRSMIPPSLADVLTVSPVSLEPLVKLIDSARVSIDLEAQYLKVPEMNAALVAAAGRGVRVSVTVASACAFGSPSASERKEIQSVYSAFDRAGISSRFFNSSNLINGQAGYMHAKVMVIDGSRAWLGSENGSVESLTENREYGVIFEDAIGVKKLLDTIGADHSDPASESMQESLGCARDKRVESKP